MSRRNVEGALRAFAGLALLAALALPTENALWELADDAMRAHREDLKKRMIHLWKEMDEMEGGLTLSVSSKNDPIAKRSGAVI